jgi:hypothetical protein
MTYAEHAMKRLLRYLGMTGATRVSPVAVVIAVACAVVCGVAAKAIGLSGLISSAIVAVVVIAVLWTLIGRHTSRLS